MAGRAKSARVIFIVATLFFSDFPIFSFVWNFYKARRVPSGTLFLFSFGVTGHSSAVFFAAAPPSSVLSDLAADIYRFP